MPLGIGVISLGGTGRLPSHTYANVTEHFPDLEVSPRLAAASIASPNFLHHEIALAAIEAGKPFWIDKPMGVNAAQSPASRPPPPSIDDYAVPTT